MGLARLRLRLPTALVACTGPRAGAICAYALATMCALPSLLTALDQVGAMGGPSAEGAPFGVVRGSPEWKAFRGMNWAVIVIRVIELPLLLVLFLSAVTGVSRLALPWLLWSPLVTLAALAQGITSTVIILRIMADQRMPLLALHSTRMAFELASNVLTEVSCVLLVVGWRRSIPRHRGPLRSFDIPLEGRWLPPRALTAPEQPPPPQPPHLNGMAC